MRPRSLLAGALVVVLAGGCGSDDTTTVADPPPSSEQVTGTDAPLPFDLGPAIVRGDGDVVADGLVLDEDRFVSAIERPPTTRSATAHRWEPDVAAVARVEAAVAELTGRDDVEVEVEGPRFEFQSVAKGPAPVETTVPAADPGGGSTYDPEAARARAASFFAAAGLDPVGRLRTFTGAGALSVETDVAVGGTVVLRATASVTFGPDGDVLGGYGPVGEAVAVRAVDVVDLDDALRRLALTTALVGFPTTFSMPTEKVTIVAAEVVLSLREVVDAGGVPTGVTWLVPAYRFIDDAGATWEVNAVVADELRIP